MKLRVQLVQRSEVGHTPIVPTNWGLQFLPAEGEDAAFVPTGTNPGRRWPIIRLNVEKLTPEAAQPFELGGEYLLTLEPVGKR